MFMSPMKSIGYSPIKHKYYKIDYVIYIKHIFIEIFYVNLTL